MLFFFNDTATTEIYTLSLHDALPISRPTTASSSRISSTRSSGAGTRSTASSSTAAAAASASTVASRCARCARDRSEEHTSELQSRQYLVCRLLLEKKKKQIFTTLYYQ